uniref:Uncharacterized protein n=1 Tax=Sus scrofa TaxID=9823 RepID=A0A8D2BVP3_PIG
TGHGATRSKANHVLTHSAVSFTPRTAPCTLSRSSRFEVVSLGYPTACFQTNRITLGAERGGTESRKGCPYWSVRKVLGRGGGNAGNGGPAHPAITIVTERAQLGVGARLWAWCRPSRGDQVRWEPVVPHA